MPNFADLAINEIWKHGKPTCIVPVLKTNYFNVCFRMNVWVPKLQPVIQMGLFSWYFENIKLLCFSIALRVQILSINWVWNSFDSPTDLTEMQFNVSALYIVWLLSSSIIGFATFFVSNSPHYPMHTSLFCYGWRRRLMMCKINL